MIIFTDLWHVNYIFQSISVSRVYKVLWHSISFFSGFHDYFGHRKSSLTLPWELKAKLIRDRETFMWRLVAYRYTIEMENYLEQYHIYFKNVTILCASNCLGSSFSSSFCFWFYFTLYIFFQQSVQLNHLKEKASTQFLTSPALVGLHLLSWYTSFGTHLRMAYKEDCTKGTRAASAQYWFVIFPVYKP